MLTLRHRHARRVVAALFLLVPITACEDKKPSNAGGVRYEPAGPRGTISVTKSESKSADPHNPYVPANGDPKPASPPAANTENFHHFVDNDYVSVVREPRSTFSASVDTAAYGLVRAKINSGQLPPKDAVRVADLLNYFDYDYPRPAGDEPVAARLELAPCPWNAQHHLLRIALAAKKYDANNMPARNLVFLIDTSGSMEGEARLPLVKKSLSLLADKLTARDRVSIVTYAGEASLRLPSVSGDQTGRIKAAIESLHAGGSTNGGGGITMAYDQAANSFIENGVNRVIIATDGDFNVGVSSEGELVRMIGDKRKTGVYLTVLGFGMGNLQDAKLEQLSHHGNGHYAYIDTLDEARKIFADQGGSLAVVAKDVKMQVEFNHGRVNAYRLIGYENRLLKNEDFRDDGKDAGDMGSGHTVTALYEIVPVGVQVPVRDAGKLKYQATPTDTPAAKTGEWLTLRVRYKHPDAEDAREMAFAMGKDGLSPAASKDFRFASAVAAFGMLLRESEYKGTATWADVREWASASVGADPRGLRGEFLELVGRTERLSKRKD
ncbi:vWA domain-containing protein [Zavarzinella formosa]|uniref:vWA domain-containing protein n=1 Tax=Zavarzinella formosa TaxID=360055 RepID=UPI0002E693BE|nr:von Willebrand factor type A domain-containing protein [Zavarzinella formosa]